MIECAAENGEKLLQRLAPYRSLSEARRRVVLRSFTGLSGPLLYAQTAVAKPPTPMKHLGQLRQFKLGREICKTARNTYLLLAQETFKL